MKKTIYGIIISAIIIMTGCTVLPWVKDVNNIRDWISVPAEDTEYQYVEEYRDYYDGELFDTDTEYYTVTVEGVDQDSDEILIELMYEENGNYDIDYMIIDSDEGIIAMSDDKYFQDDNDMIILSTPVEEGNDWLVYGDILYEIDKMNQTKKVEAGEYTDCIVVTARTDTYSWELWYSPSAGAMIYTTQTATYGQYRYEYTVELRNIKK